MGVTMTADEHDAAEPADSGASTADDGPAPVASSDSPPEFREFFTQAHVPMVRSQSLALHDDQLGRDAAAEGFARALARWSSVATMANPAGWVYRVGLNWARSRRRSRRVRRRQGRHAARQRAEQREHQRHRQRPAAVSAYRSGGLTAFIRTDGGGFRIWVMYFRISP